MGNANEQFIDEAGSRVEHWFPVMCPKRAETNGSRVVWGKWTALFRRSPPAGLQLTLQDRESSPQSPCCHQQVGRPHFRANGEAGSYLLCLLWHHWSSMKPSLRRSTLSCPWPQTVSGLSVKNWGLYACATGPSAAALPVSDSRRSCSQSSRQVHGATCWGMGQRKIGRGRTLALFQGRQSRNTGTWGHENLAVRPAPAITSSSTPQTPRGAGESVEGVPSRVS